MKDWLCTIWGVFDDDVLASGAGKSSLCLSSTLTKNTSSLTFSMEPFWKTCCSSHTTQYSLSVGILCSEYFIICQKGRKRKNSGCSQLSLLLECWRRGQASSAVWRCLLNTKASVRRQSKSPACKGNTSDYGFDPGCLTCTKKPYSRVGMFLQCPPAWDEKNNSISCLVVICAGALAAGTATVWWVKRRQSIMWEVHSSQCNRGDS